MKFTIPGAVVQDSSDPIVTHALRVAAGRRGVPYELLKSLAWSCSQFRAAAQGPAQLGGERGAGLFLLPPRLALELKVRALDPVEAADGAARLLVRLRARYRGSWAHALAAFRWGAHNVDRSPLDWPPRVRRFVKDVLEGAAIPHSFEMGVGMIDTSRKAG
jgi:hypothetical protein